MSTFCEAHLPTQFLNEIESVSPNLIVVRSSIKNLEESNEWIKEYGKLTNTRWNSRSSKPCGQKFVCLKKYVCHQSAFMKVRAVANKRSFSKNACCEATINVKIKLNTSATRKKDSYIKKGLIAVISIIDTHNHCLNTPAALKYLPSPECKEKFLRYFADGMAVAKARRHHKGILQSQGEYTGERMASSQLYPSYRTVQYWYDQWRRQKYALEAGQQSSIESSGTAAREEDKKQEYIPMEPTIVIKEEPVDYEPTPDTSTDTANEGFILPHQGPPPVHVLPQQQVVAPQFTLSVASLAPKDPEASDGEQARKKRKIMSSTVGPTTNGFEARPQSPVDSFGESSNPGSSKELRKDQFDVFGEYIATKLRSLDKRSCAYAQKAIGDIIFAAELGRYLDEDTDGKDLNTSAN